MTATSDPPEGLAWLGRAPSPRPGWRLRVLAPFGRLLAFGVLGLHLRVEGMEHRPAGPYILACAIHRSWIDAFLLVGAFPLEPRIWYLGSGAATFRRRWREWFMRRLGGILPVYRGGVSIEPHLESARAVLDAGAVFAIFPEGGRAGEPEAVQRFRGGLGYLALRTGAAILPVALAGTGELYRGKRMSLRVLPPVRPLGLAALDAPPPPGSAEEREAARAITERIHTLLAPHVLELATRTADPPEVPRRWRWLTNLFR